MHCRRPRAESNALPTIAAALEAPAAWLAASLKYAVYGAAAFTIAVAAGPAHASLVTPVITEEKDTANSSNVSAKEA
jgi:hypothetical protein